MAGDTSGQSAGMNSSSHDAKSRHATEALRADWPKGANGAAALMDAMDPTEDLANDVTVELPDSASSADSAQPHSADAGSVVVKCEAANDALAVTNGTVLSERYLVEQQLVNGGTAVISRARDLLRHDVSDGDPHVAIKLLRPEWRNRARGIARLRREFRQTQLLAHPNIVRFYDLDCDRGTWFIAMELLNGEVLGQRLRRTCPRGLPVQEALSIAAECGDALAFAHEHGITHGDVKPDNVFITSSGEVRVLDFGVAAETVSQPPPADGSMIDAIPAAATRAYASPEVLTGQSPEPRDDVFSLACVIYEMLAGRHPYGRRGADEARDAHLEVSPPPGLSTPQWRALASGLAWRREQRPGDVRELLLALGAEVPARQPMKTAVGLPVPVASGELRWASGNTWRSAAAIVAAIVLGMLIGRFGFESRGEAPSASRIAPLIAGRSPDNVSAGMVETRAFTAAIADTHDTMPPKSAPPAIAYRATSQAPPPLNVSFDAASMVVSPNAIAAAIPVRRQDRAGRSARIAWRATDGTAVAGRDYGGPGSGLASFQEGQTLGIIYVPIVKRLDAPGDRSFVVELHAASPTARLGSTYRMIVVTIQGDG